MKKGHSGACVSDGWLAGCGWAGEPMLCVVSWLVLGLGTAAGDAGTLFSCGAQGLTRRFSLVFFADHIRAAGGAGVGRAGREHRHSGQAGGWAGW